MKQGRGNDMIEVVVLGGDPGAGGTPALPVVGLYGFGMRRRSLDG